MALTALIVSIASVVVGVVFGTITVRRAERAHAIARAEFERKGRAVLAVEMLPPEHLPGVPDMTGRRRGFVVTNSGGVDAVGVGLRAEGIVFAMSESVVPAGGRVEVPARIVVENADDVPQVVTVSIVDARGAVLVEEAFDVWLDMPYHPSRLP